MTWYRRGIWRMIPAIVLGLMVLAPAAMAQYGVPLFDMGDEAEGNFHLFSSAFESNTVMPRRYTCDSRNASPPLEWSGASVRAESFAIIMDDPDAPVGTWVHWVVYNIPGTVTELPEGVAKQETLPDGTRQGLNSFGEIGYSGPCPPRGPEHRYVFRLYALDAMLDLPASATKEDLLVALEHHVLGRTKLVGRYER